MEASFIPGVAVGFITGYLSYVLAVKTLTLKVAKGGHNHKFVMVVRQDILSNKNKIALHSSRAAIECYKKTKSKFPETVKLWESNSQPKVVLKLDKNSDNEMLKLQRKAESLGLMTTLINEECLEPMKNFTVVGIGPGSEDLINQVTGHLKLL